MTATEDRARSLFFAALDRAPGDWPAFLDETCCGDARLRARVGQLLDAHRAIGSVHGVGADTPTATADSTTAADPGAVIGPYQLVEVIGEGGMGTVYLAQQTEPVKRLVALKTIKAGMDTRQVVARFEAERQALALMDHPHIAKVHDGGVTAEGRPYFVMELVRGVQITRYCDDQRLTLRERLQLFVPVCRAVQHAHQKGVIHRDLKPSNVLVAPYDDKPVPKVIDFGVAKALGQPLTEKTLVTGAVVGTPAYMSPEQARLNNLDVDTRSDVYSLGVVLYELLTGTTPLASKRVDEAGLLEALRIVREEETPRPSARLSTVAELPAIAAHRGLEPRKLSALVRGELDWVVMKCLEKDRSRRYETADALAKDVERYLSDEPVQAGPPSVGYRVRKFARRNKRAVLASALVFAALLSGTVGTAVGLVRAERALQAEAKQAQGERQARLAEGIERDRAEQEKRIAQAVRDFLYFRLLRQADAHAQADALRSAGESPVGVKENPTVRELLDRAAAELTPERIETQFPGQPLVQAEILQTVGDTYRGIGDFGQAVSHLARARDLHHRHRGPDHPDTLLSMNKLANACLDAGQLPEAIGLLERVRDKRAELLGPGHRLTLVSMNDLANAYRGAGKFREAIGLYERVRDGHVETLGPNHLETLTVLLNLGLAFVDAGRHPEAIRLFERVRDQRIETLGPDHPDSLTAADCLAGAYREAGRFPDAIRLLEQARDQRVERLGPNHPSTLVTLNNLGLAYEEGGRVAQAIALLEQVREAFVAKFGPDHPHTLTLLGNLGAAYLHFDRLPEAVGLFEHVRDRWLLKLGPDHPTTLNATHNLALAYSEFGKVPEAIELFERVRDRRVEILGPDHPRTLRTLKGLAGAYLSAREPLQAIRLYEQVRATQAAKLGPDHPNTLYTMNRLGLVYRDNGRLPEAIRLFEQVCGRAALHLGPDDPLTIGIEINLTGAYEKNAEYDRACRLGEGVLPRAQCCLGEEHPDTQILYQHMARAYSRLKRLDRAVEMLRALADRQRNRRPVDESALQGAVWNLSMTLLRAGRPAEAEPLLRECLAFRQKQDPQSLWACDVQAFLGTALYGQKKYEQAESCLVQAYEGMKRLGARVPESRLADTRARLVRLYELWGDKEKADGWRKKSDAPKEALKEPAKSKGE